MTQARLVIDSSTKNEDILWGSKFFAMDAFISLEVAGEKIIVVRPLEYGRAQKEACVDKIILNTDLSDKSLSLKEQALLLLQRCKIDMIAVSSNLPAESYKYLSDNKIRVDFEDVLFPERAIKTATELAHIEHVQRSMEEVFPILLDVLANATIREGKVWGNREHITSEMLRIMFDVEMMRRDCLCEESIIASSDQATDPHCSGSGPLIANTPIVFDMFPRSRRSWYWSDMTRTVVKGKLSPKARKMYEVVRQTQAAALEMVAHGIDGHVIHAFVKKEFEKRGFITQQVNGIQQGFFHGTGHGVGLEIHEAPTVNHQSGQILQPGNVITIEPGLYYLGIGGIRIEDTVFVTETGHKNIASISKDLLEIP